MRNFNIIAALVGTAAIATLAFAQATAPRQYTVRDDTTADTSTRGNPPVRCDANLQGVRVKCSSNVTWQAVPRGGTLRIECASDDGHLEYVGSDTEDSRRIGWGSCASNLQRVAITGTLSMCASEQLSAQSHCHQTSDTFNLQ